MTNTELNILSGITGNIQESINNILDFTKIKSIIWSDEVSGVTPTDTFEESLFKLPDNLICLFWISKDSVSTVSKNVLDEIPPANRGHMFVYKSNYGNIMTYFSVYCFFFSITENRIYYRSYNNMKFSGSVQGFQDEWKYISLLDI